MASAQTFSLKNAALIDGTGQRPLLSATARAAEAVDLADTVGTIVPSKRVDLLVVDGDPLANITILQQKDKLLGIFREGRLMIDRGMPVLTTERAA